ncbi:hypothetical protein [Streptomyces sp. NA04227]|uniref:hypothetical protein n=1 Tax=Streptomyces sp. NA04227 TaxID=2742136 RepID=UPI0020CA85A5|nr:hypothetical protein [Streptomyces sp. NA04227]
MAALAIGTVFGALAPLLEASDGMGHVAHVVLAAGWTWAALAFCVGLARKSRVESAALAAVSLTSAVIAYYATKFKQGEFQVANLADPSGAAQVSWDSFLSKTIAWCVVALFLGPLLGLAGNLARADGLRGLPFRVLVPVVTLVETTQRLRFEASLQGTVARATWTVVLVAAGVLLIGLVGHAVLARRPRASAERAPSLEGRR